MPRRPNSLSSTRDSRETVGRVWLNNGETITLIVGDNTSSKTGMARATTVTKLPRYSRSLDYEPNLLGICRAPASLFW